MSTSVQHLHVDLAQRGYPIYFADKAAASAREALASRSAKIVITDETVAQKQLPAYADLIDNSELLSFPAGEPTKCFQSLQACMDAMAARKLGRDAAVFALGGGVIGDLAGYAAASYLRGVDFYQIPTTLLAMVDSSVGGKTGINISAGKNLVGAFWQPKAVFIDTDALASLPPREFSAGMAEVIKYGMLYDLNLFELLENLDEPLAPGHPQLAAVIRRCCEIKAEIVIADEKETAASGGRALLNLGHTFAHAIENVAGYGEYLHGEAVGAGLAMATRLSIELGYLPEATMQQVSTLVSQYNLPTDLRNSLPTDALIEAMYRDKKVRAGKLRFVAMEQLGKAITVNDIEEPLVRKIWQEFGAE